MPNDDAHNGRTDWCWTSN